MRTDGGGGDWIVLLEVADESGCSTIDAGALRQLVAACGTPAPTTLYSPDRYALQMSVRAPDAPRALAAAITRWRRAMRRCDLPEWDLVRAEILTPAELEAELRDADALLGQGRLQGAPLPPPAEIDPEEEELLRRALFDPLTGLPSRELFLEEVRRALEPPSPAPAVRAILVVHVDLEEVTGPDQPPPDDLLVELAGRLTASVREGDTVARVGPCEFALLVEVPAADDTDLLARRVLDSIRWPSLDDRPPLPSVSVGVAMTSAGGDADDLFEMAALATVAAARRAGGDGHRRFADGGDSAAHEDGP